jgi:DNA (cytosine-5)-methyltransferase 1
MRYISLFSGVEAATLAWEPLGWEAVAFAEIEPFPSAVLAYRWPDVPNLGDITKVDWSEYRGAADIVVGGFPCQSYSIAGLRKGLADPRGNLMLEFLKACQEINPEWVIGENVPGLLSSNGGRDFQTLLEAVAILWPRGGISWRILDSQFMRVADYASDGTIARWVGPVAQRRRRIFLVINTRDWRRAAAVLFEPESVSGNTTSSREKRQALTADARSGPAGAGGGIAFAQNQHDKVRLIGGDGSISGALAAQRWGNYKNETLVAEPSDCLTPWDGQAVRVYSQDGTFPTLQARPGQAGQNSQSVFVGTSEPIAVDYKQTPKTSDGICHTLTHEGDGGIHSAVAYDAPVVMASAHYNAEIGEGGVAPTLIAHIAKDAPVLATATTCSQPSAQQTETSSSSTTSRSTEEGSSLSQSDEPG